ncbi:MAG TPA: hypothetical protein VFG30_17530 [Polyangiales bacterium]|nr:hypothetical protein [Polyangiales bacterium]
MKEDRDVTARLLVHLGEVDVRGLFRDLGFSSMFDYAVQALHMSESEAWLRIRAARLGREFPTALDMVARGELHMTALKLLAPVLTRSNIQLLEQARFKSKLELQTLIAKHFPQPDVPSAIRKLPTPKPAPGSAGVPAPASVLAAVPASASASATAHHVQLASSETHPCRAAKGSDAEPGMLSAAQAATQHSSEHAMPSATVPFQNGASPADSVPSAAAPVQSDVWPAGPVRGPHAVASSGPSLLRAPEPSSIVPLREGRYKVQFTASQSLVDMFGEARDLFRNQLPTGDLPSILERALALLIAERKKQRFAQTNKPRVPRLSESHAAADKVDATASVVRAEFQPAKPNSRHIAHASSEAPADEADPTASTVRADRQPSNPNSRHIPHALRRQVYARDAGRCRFVSPDGTRCRARGKLEFHQIVPFARGGEATLDNICLMCRSFNALVAERDYGRALVKRRIADRGGAPSARLRERRVSPRHGAAREDEGPSVGTSVSAPTIGLGPDQMDLCIR